MLWQTVWGNRLRPRQRIPNGYCLCPHCILFTRFFFSPSHESACAGYELPPTSSGGPKAIGSPHWLDPCGESEWSDVGGQDPVGDNGPADPSDVNTTLPESCDDSPVTSSR